MLMVFFDVEYLWCVLVNLLDNVLCYVDDGVGVVCVMLSCDGVVFDFVVCSVGLLVFLDVECYFFEFFFLMCSCGFGLGFYICCELCECYGVCIDYCCVLDVVVNEFCVCLCMF